MRRPIVNGITSLLFAPVAAAALVALSACGGGDAAPADPGAGPGQAAAAAASGGGPGQRGMRPGGRPGGRPGADASVPVRTAALERRDIASVYRTSTTLRAARTAPVPARAAGILRRTLVEEGDRVAKGAVMARLEDDQARLELDQAKVDLEIAVSELDRAERLRGENLVSIEEYDQKRNAAARARTELQISELELAFTQITAPFAGTVTRRLLDPGSTVSAGDAVFELADTTTFFADVAVPESVAARLAPGSAARLVSTALDTTFPAVIERLAPSVDPQTGTVKVTLAVRPRDGLRAGSFVDVAIETEVHPNALVAPSNALVADGDAWHVYTIDDGRAVRVTVTSGFEDADGVEIVPVSDDAPLDGGTEVVVGGVAALSDGTPVRVEGPPGTEKMDDGRPAAAAGAP